MIYQKSLYLIVITFMLYGCGDFQCDSQYTKDLIKQSYSYNLTRFVEKYANDNQIIKYEDKLRILKIDFKLKKISEISQKMNGELLECNGSLVATYKDQSVSLPITYHVEKYEGYNPNLWTGKLTKIEIQTLLRLVGNEIEPTND